MRLTHLSDSEIQAFADRHDRLEDRWLSQDQASDHLEQHEHICTCVKCRETLAQYESLYGELAQSSHSHASVLPRNFARKVTLSIPPFAAAHARATIRLWTGAGAAFLLMVSWWLCTLNWTVLISKAAAGLMIVVESAHGWFLSVASRVSLPALASVDRWMPHVEIDRSQLLLIMTRLVADPWVFTFAICAGIAAYLVTSADDLILMEYIRRRDR
jgi:hypothetical protein